MKSTAQGYKIIYIIFLFICISSCHFFVNKQKSNFKTSYHGIRILDIIDKSIGVEYPISDWIRHDEIRQPQNPYVKELIQALSNKGAKTIIVDPFIRNEILYHFSPEKNKLILENDQDINVINNQLQIDYLIILVRDKIGINIISGYSKLELSIYLYDTVDFQLVSKGHISFHNGNFSFNQLRESFEFMIESG